MQRTTKGFTLIELLVVIAIVAILAVVVILTLNPAELLKQARDSNRVSDFATLKSAISLYLADVSTPALIAFATSSATYNNCFVSTPTGASTSSCHNFATVSSSSAPTSTTVGNLRKVDGTGWLPVNFTVISSGAPVGNLPVDPVNNTANYYSYVATSSNVTFEINTVMESVKFRQGGSGDVVTTDGGNNNLYYEVGTAAGLAL